MAQEYYTVKIVGLERRFPLLEVAPGVKIALFNMLGDTEIVRAAAKALAERLPKNADVLVTPAEKSIPLAYELSVQTKLPYVVVRKERKPYMLDCLSTEVISITTGKPQTLWLDGKDRGLIKGKNVILVDDVISTGSTLRGLRDLVAKAEGKIVAEAAVFTEGDPAQWQTVIALGNLPVFISKK
jgi:adenine/guanine phosphoribosyltransferase-like PRPP-binding protein